MRKNTSAVIEAFKQHCPCKPCPAISTDGQTIYSYTTPIARRKQIPHDTRCEVELVSTKFSPTTTRQQNAIRQSFPYIVEVDTL